MSARISLAGGSDWSPVPTLIPLAGFDRSTPRQIKVKVAFSSEDADAKFKCKLDKADYKPCASPYSIKAKSKPGKGMKHKISVKAKDGDGNVGEAATVEFRVIRKGRG